MKKSEIRKALEAATDEMNSVAIAREFDGKPGRTTLRMEDGKVSAFNTFQGGSDQVPIYMSLDEATDYVYDRIGARGSLLPKY